MQLTRTRVAHSVLQSPYKNHPWPLPHWWQVSHTDLPSGQASCFTSLLPRCMGGKDGKAPPPRAEAHHPPVQAAGRGVTRARERQEMLGACDELLSGRK